MSFVPVASPVPPGTDPRILVAPPSTQSDLGQDAIDLAAHAGLVLDPWQEQVLRVGLAEAGDRWAAFEVALVVARQNGKDSILEALQLAKLFLCGDELIIHSAHEFKTAKEAFRRVWALIDGDSELRARTLRRVLNPSEQGVDLKSGQRLRFFARTNSGSGRGWTADTLILNEAFRLGGEAMAAMLPTLSAAPSGNPQVWYASSAALADSEQLHALRRRALAGDTTRLAYLEWSAREDDDHADPGVWRAANPSPRVPDDFIAAEFEAMPLPQFRRERLSIPDEPGGGVVFPDGAWRACEEWPLQEQAGRLTFAVEVTPDRERAAIVAAGVRPDGRVLVEVVDAQSGTAWILPKLELLAKRWRPDSLILDPGSAAGALIRDLDDARIKPRLTSTREVGQACGAFFDGVLARQVVHLGQTELDVAVAGAAKRKLGDAWAWDRFAHDASPLMAASLAFYAVTTRPARVRAVNLSAALEASETQKADS